MSIANMTRPPGPRGRLLLGDFPDFLRDPLGFLQGLARQHGDVVAYRMGPEKATLLVHPDDIKDVLVTRQRCFHKGNLLKRARAILGEGLLTSETNFHMRQRRLVQPAFSKTRLARYGEIFVLESQTMAAAWQPNTEVNMHTEMMALTLSIVARTLFGANVSAESDEVGHAIAKTLRFFNYMLLPMSEILSYLPFPAAIDYRRARRRLDQTIFRIIQDRYDSGRDEGDLLSMLLMARDEETDNSRLSMQQVRDEALTLFLAGHETTANALTFAWYLLAQHPEAQTTLAAELQTQLGDRPPTWSDVARLPFTGHVISETLRLYPPVWAVGRQVVEEVEVGGYTLPLGSLVLLSPYVTQRDARYFDDPDSFKPQRWAVAAERPKFSYFPFGGGAHVCVGEHFARAEAVLILATLAQRWRPNLASDFRLQLTPSITLRAKSGIPMRLEEN